MPPPIVPAVSSSEEEESFDSDSESDSSIKGQSRDPLEVEELELIMPNHTSARSTTRPVNHTLGKLINNGKRKAESQPHNGHPLKAQRTAYDDGDQDNNDDSDSAEGPGTNPTYAQQSFAAGPVPIVIGKTTTIDLYRQQFPQFEIPNRLPNFVTSLSMMAIKRIPATRSIFNDKKPQNLAAYLMQALGDVVPREQACERCIRNNGAFDGTCVVARIQSALMVTEGACANCWYNRQGSICTLRHPDRRANLAPPTATSTTPIPIPQIPAPVAPPPPSPPLVALLHPSYAAALAAIHNKASSPSPAFTSRAAPPPPAPPAPPAQSTQPSPLPSIRPPKPATPVPIPAQSTSKGRTTITDLLGDATHARQQAEPLAEESKTALWEAKYRAMSRPEVIETYQQLLDMQEDLTVRMRAMNRVVLGKLKAASILKAGESAHPGR
ncbi:hypothetical protein QBC43DRAFT_309771 [Cladorrhinum sp. PSN259]|nr:hypothetical protein QBC43DRAFT_309771 [Cladorrhinum sp. PSN259]